MSACVAVEDTYSIAGRGTVVTGRIEKGTIKPGEEVEIVGLTKTLKSTVTVTIAARDEGPAAPGCRAAPVPTLGALRITPAWQGRPAAPRCGSSRPHGMARSASHALATGGDCAFAWRRE